MTISEKIVEIVNNYVRLCGTMTAMSRRELFLLVSETYDINYNSFLPQDYCYNRTNMGIKFTEHAHVLEYIDADCYRLLGENYPYTGLIIHKPKGFVEIEVGQWENGEAVFFDERYG